MINYMRIMEFNFPSESVSCPDGSPTDFNCIVFHDYARTQEELDALWLGTYKNDKRVEINKKTDALIATGGFTFDGHVFSATAEDRMNYGHLDQFQAELPWPMDVATQNDTVYSLTLANLPSFIGAALGWVNATLQGGNALKDQVNSAVDIEGVDAVVDNR